MRGLPGALEGPLPAGAQAGRQIADRVTSGNTNRASSIIRVGAVLDL